LYHTLASTFFFFVFIELGTGYATNQIARLNYYLYFATRKTNYKKTADKLLPIISSKLSRKGGIAKLYKDKEKNVLASVWYKHNKLLQRLISSKTDYFTITKGL